MFAFVFRVQPVLFK